MNGFLASLAARVRGGAGALQRRQPSLFEPSGAGDFVVESRETASTPSIPSARVPRRDVPKPVGLPTNHGDSGIAADVDQSPLAVARHEHRAASQIPSEAPPVSWLSQQTRHERNARDLPPLPRVDARTEVDPLPPISNPSAVAHSANPHEIEVPASLGSARGEASPSVPRPSRESSRARAGLASDPPAAPMLIAQLPRERRAVVAGPQHNAGTRREQTSAQLPGGPTPVHVTIGTIEVRAVTPAAAPQKPRRPMPPSLDDFLRHRGRQQT